MITNSNEYYEKLHIIQNENPPSLALLPAAEKIYSIDISTRQVEIPEFLSVEKDHRSETIYFSVNRYADYMDLSHTICVIQYINALGEARLYPVPFFDITTCAKEGKMLLPWNIDGAAAKAAGNIQFSIRFYLLDNEGKTFLYNLNTIPVESKILYGMEVQELMENEYVLSATQYEELRQDIDKISRDFHVYWTILN